MHPKAALMALYGFVPMKIPDCLIDSDVISFAAYHALTGSCLEINSSDLKTMTSPKWEIVHRPRSRLLQNSWDVLEDRWYDLLDVSLISGVSDEPND